MRIVTLDFETFFSDDYTLKKLSTEAYVRDKRFEAHGAAIKWGPDYAARWYDERQLRQVLADEDWSHSAICCHHTHFDGLILAHHYDVRPRIWLDTLAMARLLLGNHLSVSLDSVRTQFNLPVKRTPYDRFKGRHWHELDRETQELIAEGCCDEVESIWTIFNKLAGQFPASQYAVVDCITRMFVDPVLSGDADFFGRVWTSESSRRNNLFDGLGVTSSDLRSDGQFAKLLITQGIEPGMKAGKNGPIYAFAKTDPFMQDLLDSDDDVLANLAQARLTAESSIQMTRAETLGWMSTRGPLTVYLRPYGARTTRPSGGDRSNFLNMKKADPDLPVQADNVSLKGGIKAPEGYLLAPVDASQIECRLLNTLAGQWDVVDTFRNGEDPYAKVASAFYGYPVNKREHPAQRQVGKVLELQCLGLDTVVLTDSGPKAITGVQLQDRLWDGIEWVRHQGLLERGNRSTINIAGDLWLTPDHRVLCGSSWLEAHTLQNVDVLYRALVTSSGSLRLRDIKLGTVAGLSQWLFNVAAALLNTSSIPPIFKKGELRAAINVLRKHLDIGKRNFTATPIFARMNPIDGGLWGEYERALRAVIHSEGIGIMENAGYWYFVYGRTAQKVLENFWLICLRCPDGINRLSSWIVSTITKVTDRAIYNLLPGEKILQTEGRWPNTRKQLPTYDLACAGPRSRFTVVTSVGNLIVHNCGYMSGAAKILASLRNKAGIVLLPEQGVIARDAYRSTHPAVCELWRTAGRMIARLAGGDPMQWGPVELRDGHMWLPNGCPLIYDTLEYHCEPVDDQGGGDEYWRVKTRRGWEKLYGAKLVENLCQALAWCLVSDAMVRIDKAGIRTLNAPYDELLLLIPRDGHEDEALAFAINEMRRTPEWLPELPLDAEGELRETYG